MYIKTNWIAGETEVSAENLNKIEEGIYKNSLEINSLIEDIEGTYVSTDSAVGYAKDVEILGNTIQDASNLADIRSVGDKVEGQELYEIPVLSCGKNLFDLGDMTYTVPVRRCFVSAYKLPLNTNFTISLNFVKGTSFAIFLSNTVSDISNHDTLYSTVVADKKGVEYTSTNGRISFNSANYKYLYITSWVRDSDGIEVNNIQIEEGTQATPYEPYQEDKLTILSPVQLEKVGDVADRIIEKDGVWGVEKNVIDYEISGEESIGFYTKGDTDDLIGFSLNTKNLTRKSYITISNKFTPNPAPNTSARGIHFGNDGYMYIRVNRSELKTEDVAGFRDFIKGTFVKYQTTQPTFIPLPHDQQVKLRTFANKTNISFLTEIEGTIKAQVPKSLGATVNAHTEQISNLNKELDRVKKLEESTVSTVTTESDFTTVEATSNGYFEDVKLEGKTLVNLVIHNNLYFKRGISVIGVGTDLTSTINKNLDDRSSRCTYKVSVKPNTIYTIIHCNSNIDTSHSIVHSSNNIIVEPYATWVNNKTFKTGATTDTVWIHLRVDANNTDFTSIDQLQNHLLILEGDHTQNPPSYFEGLKSVGQSATTSEDGVDEIVVSSVGENLFDGELESGTITGSGVNIPHSTEIRSKNFIKVKPNTTYTIKTFDTVGQPSIRYYDKNKNFFGNFPFSQTDTLTFTTPSGCEYVRFRLVTSDLTQRISLIEGNLIVSFVPYKSDKKRLLYYNNETQTWEKPILREWDSIEKHADGKYYYHKRSGEVVLNGSESWGSYTNLGNTSRCYFTAKDSIGGKHGLNAICDKFNQELNGNVNIDMECIWLSPSNNRVGLHISTSKLSTQDVQGFKQWLQANNVTVVYQLAQEKVYECTNIDLITYANETNYVVNCGAIVPRTTLKVHNNISNVVSLLQKKVSLLEGNVKASQEVQDMMILETDMRMLDIELALMEFIPMTLNLGGSNMLRSATYFNFLKNHIVNETYSKEYLENVMNKYLATGRINQDEYDELYKMLYPPVYDIELPIEY